MYEFATVETSSCACDPAASRGENAAEGTGHSESRAQVACSLTCNTCFGNRGLALVQRSAGISSKGFSNLNSTQKVVNILGGSVGGVLHLGQEQLYENVQLMNEFQFRIKFTLTVMVSMAFPIVIFPACITLNLASSLAPKLQSSLARQELFARVESNVSSARRMP